MLSVDIMDVAECLCFAEEAWNRRSQSVKNFGGIQRTKNQFIADQTEGKLSEILFMKFLKKKGLSINLDFNHYQGEHNTDNGDFTVGSQSFKTRVDIKGSSHIAQWLLVEDYKFFDFTYKGHKSDIFVMTCFKDGFPNNRVIREDPYSLLDSPEYEGEVRGWALAEDFYDSDNNLWFEWKRNSSPWQSRVLPDNIPYGKNRKTLNNFLNRKINESENKGWRTNISIPLSADLNYGLPIKWLRTDWDSLITILEG